MKINRNLLIQTVIGLLFFFSIDPAFCVDNTVKPDGNYTFTSDWFSKNIPNWTRALSEVRGKPGLSYLEIGVWEGRSFFWVLDNILTHPSSGAIAIDIFSGDEEQRFLDNIRRSGHSSKIRVIKGFSQQELRNLKLNSLDLIYIDGDHRSKGVLMDAMLSWDLLKDGGILIFDDYKFPPDLPREMRPEFAIDVFVSLFQDEIQILKNEYQLIVRKAKTHCDSAMGFIERWDAHVACSRLGPYVYYWKPQKLFDATTNEEITLDKGEVSLVENTLLGLKFGCRLELETGQTDPYRNLLTKLRLNEISVSGKER
jgi:predicted O-methyltransferase YrrM